MFLWTGRTAAAIALPALFVLTACGGEPREGAETQEVAQATYEVQVTNPMPHAMIIYADYGTGEKTELGTVEPMGTATFTITSPPSTSVRLTAQDSAATHEVFGEVTLTTGMAASWTAGQ